MRYSHAPLTTRETLLSQVNKESADRKDLNFFFSGERAGF